MRGRPGRERLTYTSDEAIQLKAELVRIGQMLAEHPVPGVRLVMGQEELIDPIRFDDRAL